MHFFMMYLVMYIICIKVTFLIPIFGELAIWYSTRQNCTNLKGVHPFGRHAAVRLFHFFSAKADESCQRFVNAHEGQDVSLICMVGSFHNQSWCDGRIVKKRVWPFPQDRCGKVHVPYGKFIGLIFEFIWKKMPVEVAQVSNDSTFFLIGRIHCPLPNCK